MYLEVVNPTGVNFYSFVGVNNLMELKMLGINPVDVILDMGKQRCFIYTSRRVN